MTQPQEFRWFFVVKGDEQELETAAQVAKDVKISKIQESGKTIISFSELSNIEKPVDAWSAAWPLLYRLNKLIAAFIFRPKDIDITGEVYEADGTGKAYQRADIPSAVSRPVTLLTPIQMSDWKDVLDRFDKNMSWKVKGKIQKDELLVTIINHLAENDYKDYYIVYEIICKELKIPEGNFEKVAEFSGVAADEVGNFYRTANALHRHKKARKPPPNPINEEAAKIVTLRLMMAWLERRYPA